MDAELKSNKYALAYLKDSHASLGGDIKELEKQIALKRVQIAHIDAVILMMDPDFDFDTIRAKRKAVRDGDYAVGRVARAVLDILRTADRPLKVPEIVRVAMAALGADEYDTKKITHQVRNKLDYYRNRHGVVIKSGKGEGSTWEMARDELPLPIPGEID